MKVINSINLGHEDEERIVQLCVGDLADLELAFPVDALVVSAFPDNYLPTRSSLIGSLQRSGISVKKLSRDKAVDLREFSSCWLSQVVNPPAYFRRVLCFEHEYRGRAPEVVGDIFRSIMPFTAGEASIRSISLPMVAAGNQGEDTATMLKSLTNASVHWLSIGMPLKKINLVLHPDADLEELEPVFQEVKGRHDVPEPKEAAFKYDAFVSYSHANKDAVDELVQYLVSRRPKLRIFVDRLELTPGAAWQQHIFEALDESRKVICIYSPNYLASRVCKEEFNMALLRHRESEQGVLLPILLKSAELPTYMKLVQYFDAREGDSARIAESAEVLLSEL